MKLKLKYSLISILLLSFMISCDDFLDRKPLDRITPTAFFNGEADLAAYTAQLYNGDAGFTTIAPGQYGLSTFKADNHTDNQAAPSASARWMPGEWRVPATGGGWDFGAIRRVNYFLEQVLPKLESKSITGNDANIRHYIGEVYVMRANIYFNKLQKFGDFPIINTVLPDKEEALIEASKRKPRNEVARFILSDLDEAVKYLKEESPNKKNRISKKVAYLLKSRVALHEGTWLKYHKGTPQISQGIDADSESKFFLKEATESAKKVADAMMGNLTVNSKERVGRNVSLSSLNDYYVMFCDDDMDKYPEVLFWRDYATGQVTHNIQMELLRNGGGSGYTKGLVESFLMTNGLPIYAGGSGYAGDTNMDNVIKNRDYRLQLFTKIKGDIVYYNDDKTPELAPAQQILDDAASRSVTGYTVKKGMNYDKSNADSHHVGLTGSIVFRGVEAMLNYMEADYELNGSLDGNSVKYWKEIRTRAGIDADFNKTITATDMNMESKGDFGAYSKGQLVDATLYNIRRERRNEFIAEGMRWMDLKRWRAMDQLIAKPYIIEGFHLWNTEMEGWYKASDLVVNPESGRVSPKENSEYLRPYQIVKNQNLYYDGYKWNVAHYLDPLPMSAFRLTATEKGNIGSSEVYQNPGWSKTAGESIK